VITLLPKQGATDVCAIVRAIIPDADIRRCVPRGVYAVFTPGADITSIVDTVWWASTEVRRA
jgi:methylmalonyl-CoA mutase cobalamin-binding domain/chain